VNLVEQLHQARKASKKLRTANGRQKNLFLEKLEILLLENITQILKANKKDLVKAVNLTPAIKKRLTLTADSIKSIAQGIKKVVDLPDPVGAILKIWKRPNGMQVGKMRVPIGVIFFVFESRPNVIVDAAALAVKSGNALVARGGKEALNSNTILSKLIASALKASGLPKDSVQHLQEMSHETVARAVKMNQYVDLVVARGRPELIKSIKENSAVPVIAHERGLCHIYIDEDADVKKGVKIAVNAKTSNPSTCNSVETILVHQKIAAQIIKPLIDALLKKGVEIRGCKKTRALDKRCLLAAGKDWETEYLNLILSIKTVNNYEEALGHIEKYSSGLSEAIITENYQRARDFLEKVNSAAVLVNASTRLVDGGEFGLGAEFGISTAAIHMKGPMGLEDLTVTKYIVLGDGQIRE
jgi:glutamate-5-semialdehyde dehydrogenase